MSETVMVPHSVMASQVEAAVLAERERCAKIAESYTSPTDDTLYGLAARDIAAKIREGQ